MERLRGRRAKRLARVSLVVAAALLALVSVAGSLHAAGVPATAVQLNLPTAAVPLPGGGFLIADSQGEVIRKVDATGDITTVAGDGTDCRNTVFCEANGADMVGDNGPATKAQLDDPTDAVPTPDGGFLIADATWNLGGGNGAVRKVSASGIITTVAGGAPLQAGSYQVCAGATDAIGDGCPATQATLADPTAAVPTSDGGFLIADAGDSVIRKVSASGIITTVAGGASPVCAAATDSVGDGCPATQAQLGFPTAAIPFNIAGAAVGTQGSGFLIADEQNCDIRYVNASGVITTVAGTGVCTPTSGAASGPATSVGLEQPTDARPTADGGFLVADAGNCRVLKVSSVNSGTATTVVPTPPSCNPGGQVVTARTFTAAIPAPGGGFLATTADNHVEQVSSSGKISVVAGNVPGSGAHRPTCSFTHSSNSVPLRAAAAGVRSKSKRPKDALLVTFRCDQAAQIKVGGVVKETLAGKHHHTSVKRIALGTRTLSVRAGRSVTVALKLPKAAISALQHGAKESATLTLVANNANGSSRATKSINRLKPG